MNSTSGRAPETVRWAEAGALTGGVLATLSMVGVVAGEIVQGEDFMGSVTAQLLGWGGFAAACALVLGVAGLGVALAPVLSPWLSRVWVMLMLATATTTGAAATLALVVPALADRAPALATDPPAAVPATFILSGLAMGVSGVFLGLGLRRAVPALPRWTVNLFVVGAVVSILPLPSRFFLLSFGVAMVLARVQRPPADRASAAREVLEAAAPRRTS
jgi:hypothetical protein